MMLRVTSCQGENTHAAGRAVTAYLGDRLGIETEFVLDLPWEERKAALLSGEIDVGWVCGLWYARQAAQPHPPWELLATPVYQGARYANRPVYFSDIVVQRDSAINDFAGLAGTTWAYNEPESLSGNMVMQYALAERNLDINFFGRVVESGGHMLSLGMLADGRADVAAIDSTVWEYAQATRPDLCARLRIIEVLGPNLAPPWVVSFKIPASLRAQIREVLLGMHNRLKGIDILQNELLCCFKMVEDSLYHSYQLQFKSV